MGDKKIYHQNYCWALIIGDGKVDRQTVNSCDCNQSKLFKNNFPNVINLSQEDEEEVTSSIPPSKEG